MLSVHVSNEVSICEISIKDAVLRLENVEIKSGKIDDYFELVKREQTSSRRILEEETKVSASTENKIETKKEEEAKSSQESQKHEKSEEEIHKNNDKKSEEEIHKNNSEDNTKFKSDEINKNNTDNSNAYSHLSKSEENSNNSTKSIENSDKTNPHDTPITDNSTSSSHEQAAAEEKEHTHSEENEETQYFIFLFFRSHHQYQAEDQMAKKAFYITVSFLTVFILLFIYNLIRCYTKGPQIERPVDSRGYSRELQNSTAVEDDAVLDLSAVA